MRRRVGPRERGLRDLSWRDWRAVYARAVWDMGDDSAALLAGGVAFYAFVSLFPGILAVLAVYGLVADPAQVEAHAVSILTALPADARGFVEAELHNLARSSGGTLSLQLVGAVLGALWTASLGVTGLLKAVRIAYDQEEHRNFLQLRWTGILLTLGMIAYLAASTFLLAVLPAVLSAVGLEGATLLAAQALRWGGLAALSLVALTLVYHVGPSSSGRHPKWTSPGTVTAAALWAGASVLFSWWAGGVSDYGSTYGGVTGVVVLLLWLFLSTLAILFGAEVNAEAERQVKGTIRPREGETPWDTVKSWWSKRRR